MWLTPSNKNTKHYLTVPRSFHYWLAYSQLFLLVFLVQTLFLRENWVYEVFILFQWLCRNGRPNMWKSNFTRKIYTPRFFLIFLIIQNNTVLPFYIFVVRNERRRLVAFCKSKQGDDDHVLSVRGSGLSQRNGWSSRSSGVIFHSTFLSYYWQV
jgi:hypothetical protein